MMKKWPDFNERGDLPPGIHQATLTQVLEHFKRDGDKRGIVEVIEDD
jgi:hypothetical protein